MAQNKEEPTGFGLSRADAERVRGGGVAVRILPQPEDYSAFVAVTNLIHCKTSGSVQGFAEAFRIREEA